MIDKKLFFLTHELLLINTCCWRADHKILIHDGKNWSELIFVSARQHVLINDNLPVRKNYMDSDIKQNENARVLQHLQMDSFEADIASVYIQCHQPKYMLRVNNMNNHMFHMARLLIPSVGKTLTLCWNSYVQHFTHIVQTFAKIHLWHIILTCITIIP